MIKTKRINLNAFSIPGYLLPTFQQAKSKELRTWYGKLIGTIVEFVYINGETERGNLILKKKILKIMNK